MNRINPNKLLLSKFTAVEVLNKERHFIVSGLIKNEEETIIACQLEAIMTKNTYEIDWKNLQDNKKWLMGWK